MDLITFNEEILNGKLHVLCSVIYLVGVVKVIQSGKDVISDGLCWVSVEFLVSGGVG